VNGRVLVMCASRNRPESIARMIESVVETSSVADVAVYIDKDQRAEYESLAGLPCDVFCGDRMFQCRSLNLLAERNPGYEAYGAATDDCLFVSKGWDQWVIEQSGGFRANVGSMVPQTVGGYKKRMDFPWLTGRWVEVVGKFVPTDTRHFYWDVALQVLGEQTQIAYADESSFGIRHEEMLPTREEPVAEDADGPTTDFGIRLFNVYADAKEVCGWMATEKDSVLERIRSSIEEGR
jgi:hypothetical protein